MVLPFAAKAQNMKKHCNFEHQMGLSADISVLLTFCKHVHQDSAKHWNILPFPLPTDDAMAGRCIVRVTESDVTRQ